MLLMPLTLDYCSQHSPGFRCAQLSTIILLTTKMFRFFDIFRLFPIRVARFLRHFTHIFKISFLQWFIESCFLFFEIFGIFDIYDIFASLTKRARPMTDREIIIARSVFGDNIAYTRVRLDERAYWGPRKGSFCYVSCNTINSWGILPDAVLIHELMHIWQYQHLGIVYIPRALAAQFSAEGYNYGGATALYEAIKQDKHLLDFNYEQQADIIEDYYRILTGLPTSWGNGCVRDLEVYAHFVKQLYTSII